MDVLLERVRMYQIEPEKNHKLPHSRCKKRVTEVFVVSILLIACSALPGEVNRPRQVDHQAKYLERARVWLLEKKGQQHVWYADGTPKAHGDFRNNQREGYWKFYYPNGKLKGEGTFVHNLREKLWKLYYDTGALKEEGQYEKNRKEGHWKRYYPGDVLESEGDYVHGKKEGVWHNYYDNGQAFYTGTYHNDLAEGKWTYFFKNGAAYQSGSYQKDVRVGKWRVCIFPLGPCEDINYHPSATPRMAGLPPPEAGSSRARDTSNPAALLESLDTGPVPEQVPEALRKKNWNNP